MQSLVLRLFANALALWLAATIVQGVHLSSNFGDVIIVAVVFGLVNALVKPVVQLLAFPLVFLTLGLLTLVINAAMLMLTDSLSRGLTVEDFTAAFLGALVISVVNVLLGVGKEED